jgi:NADH:ubiquinone oxidoreductase subunit 2 (subunit N)
MYMHEPGESMQDLTPPSFSLRVAIWASAIGVLVLGIFPSTLLSFVSFSAATFR